jgi:hypothetical protein
MITSTKLAVPAPPHPGGTWPTPVQTLLLRAALLEAPAALQAWTAWKDAIDFDAIDSASFRLLGLAYRNLTRIGVDPSDSLLPRLKGIYRHFWTRNQLVLKRKTDLLRALNEADIPTMLLKGAALTLSVYHDFGVRPMEDFDLMVPREHVPQAMDLLEKFGWNSEVHHPRDLPQSIHACSFRNADASCIDLHWRLCHLPASEEFERTLWQQDMPATLQGMTVAVPGWTDQFLHTCAHGPQFKIVSPIRWLADAFHILREARGSLDWKRIAANAPRVGAVQGARDTLSFLREHLAPSGDLEGERLLRKVPVPLQERWENFFLRRPTPTPWHRMPLDFSHYLRCTRGQKWTQRLRGFRGYFRHANNLTPGQFSTHCRRWLGYYLRLAPRIFSRPEPGSLPTLATGTLRGFNEIEPHRHRVFRWSHPNAMLNLRIPPDADCKVALDTGNLRYWKSDLSHHLRFTFEGVPVPAENVKSKGGILTITLPRVPPNSTAPSQSLAWTCEPHPAPGDPRKLGLPVFAVRVIPLRRKPAQEPAGPIPSPSLQETSPRHP